MTVELATVRRRTSRGSSTKRCLAAAIALASASGAWADDPNPYYIGVSQAITHDSNVYRAPNAKADTYYSTGLLAGVDQPFGRQHFYANGNVQLNRFSREDTQNNTSYGLKTGLDWSTIERISGSLSVALNQGLASYSGTSTIPVETKNVQTSEQYAARVQWGAASLLTLDAGLAHNRLRYSAEIYKFNNLTQDVANVGVTYRPSSALSLGAGLRHTRGRYPEVGDNQGNAFSRNDLDLTTLWNASGRSTLNARVSIGRQQYNGASARDFSGITGALGWVYKPTGKLTLTTGITRDTGADTSFLGTPIGSTQGIYGDNSRITNSISVKAGYMVTGKINATASLRYSRRSLENTLLDGAGAAQSITGRDSSNGASLGVNYAPARNWLLACNLGHDSRSASQDALAFGLSYDYSANTVGCSAQFTLQ